MSGNAATPSGTLSPSDSLSSPSSSSSSSSSPSLCPFGFPFSSSLYKNILRSSPTHCVLSSDEEREFFIIQTMEYKRALDYGCIHLVDPNNVSSSTSSISRLFSLSPSYIFDHFVNIHRIGFSSSFLMNHKGRTSGQISTKQSFTTRTVEQIKYLKWREKELKDNGNVSDTIENAKERIKKFFTSPSESTETEKLSKESSATFSPSPSSFFPSPYVSPPNPNISLVHSLFDEISSVSFGNFCELLFSLKNENKISESEITKGIQMNEKLNNHEGKNIFHKIFIWGDKQQDIIPNIITLFHNIQQMVKSLPFSSSSAYEISAFTIISLLSIRPFVDGNLKMSIIMASLILRSYHTHGINPYAVKREWETFLMAIEESNTKEYSPITEWISSHVERKNTQGEIPYQKDKMYYDSLVLPLKDTRSRYLMDHDGHWWISPTLLFCQEISQEIHPNEKLFPPCKILDGEFWYQRAINITQKTESGKHLAAYYFSLAFQLIFKDFLTQRRGKRPSGSLLSRDQCKEKMIFIRKKIEEIYDQLELNNDPNHVHSTSSSQFFKQFQVGDVLICSICNEFCVKHLLCSLCKKAQYCSTHCQKKDWKIHKGECNKKEKEKEMEMDSGQEHKEK